MRKIIKRISISNEDWQRSLTDFNIIPQFSLSAKSALYIFLVLVAGKTRTLIG